MMLFVAVTWPPLGVATSVDALDIVLIEVVDCDAIVEPESFEDRGPWPIPPGGGSMVLDLFDDRVGAVYMRVRPDDP
jgi:hypothetical protein